MLPQASWAKLCAHQTCSQRSWRPWRNWFSRRIRQAQGRDSESFNNRMKILSFDILKFRKIKEWDFYILIINENPIGNSDVRNDVENNIRNDVGNYIINCIRKRVKNYAGIDVGRWDRKRRNFSRSLLRRLQNLINILNLIFVGNSPCYYLNNNNNVFFVFKWII